MAIDIFALEGLPKTRFGRSTPNASRQNNFSLAPPGASVIPRNRPNTVSPPPGGYTGVNPFVTPFVPMEMPMAMPSVLPKPKPQMQGPQPAPKLVLPDELTMPQMNNQAGKTGAAQLAPQGGLLGNLLASDLNSAKGRGIMSAAASLLESGGPVVGAPSPSIGQALGRAYTAGMGAFDTQKAADLAAQQAADARESQAITDRYKTAQAAQMERAANQPILQDLGNGAYTRVTDPVTGDSKIVENTDVKNYLEELAIKKQTKNINLSDKQIEAQTEELDNIAANNDLLSETDGFLDLIEDGELEFGVFDAMGDSVALTTGLGDTQEAMNSQAFTRYINKLRNELLRMAKGVQTEGDADRVIKELVTGVESRNTEAVKKALIDLRRFQNQTITRLKAKVQNRRTEKGLSKYDFGNQTTADGVGYSVVEEDD